MGISCRRISQLLPCRGERRAMHKTHHPCDLIVKADFLLLPDPGADSGARTLENAAVAVKDGLILAMGSRSELGFFQAAKELELGNCLIMPGLVNAHTHAPMTLFRGMADDVPLMDWLKNHIDPIERRLTPELVRLGTMLGCAEMLSTGTIAFLDMYLFADTVADVVDQCGMYARIGEGLSDGIGSAYVDLDEAIAAVRGQTGAYRGHPRIGTAIMPHSIYTASGKTLEICRDLALELDVPLHFHLSETLDEARLCLEQHNVRPVEYCRRLGLLGPDTSLAHCVHLDDDEIDILAATGTRVVHNPRSNLKLGSGIARVPDMLKAGVSLSLGTDGAASNNRLNMFSEMGACCLIHKGANQNPSLVPARAALEMATLGGAAALGFPDLGRLEAGGPANLIALDLDHPNMVPLYHPVSHLAYAATGHEVRLTMVRGEILYQDGAHKTIDYAAVLAEITHVRKYLQKLCRNGV